MIITPYITCPEITLQSNHLGKDMVILKWWISIISRHWLHATWHMLLGECGQESEAQDYFGLITSKC